MNFVRKAGVGSFGALGTVGNALLILWFGAMAYKTARAHNAVAHRRWALRTYLVANAQWFIRIGYIGWLFANHGHDGGFFRVWNFGCYLLPLGVLELYLRAK